MNAREVVDRGLRWAMLGALGVVFAPFAALVGVLLVRGLPALRWSLLFRTPGSGFYLGEAGGVAHAILGTLSLVSGAGVVSIALALPAALALQRGFAPARFCRAARLALDVLWGTPSIVYGAVAFVLMVHLGIRASLMGGILALSMVMLPFMIRGMDEVMRAVPEELREVPLALGATRLEMVRAVLLRQALPGIVTAVLLALGRGAGDAASVLFTAGFTDNLPGSLRDPVASLPLAVFFQISSPLLEVRQRAYASALVLLLLVLALTLASRVLERRFTKNVLR